MVDVKSEESFYDIKANDFTEALAKLVQKFKTENPGVGKFEATCHDGSKVVIRIANNTKSVVRETRVSR